jgi:hypothetical protein
LIEKSSGGWRLEAEYYYEGKWRPRTLGIERDFFPSVDLQISDGVLIHVDGGNQRRYTVVEIARMILNRALDDDPQLEKVWTRSTVKKFFTYEVVYVGQAYGRKERCSAITRLADGHEKLQKALATVNDYYRNSDVGLIIADADVSGRDLSFTITSKNTAEMAIAMTGVLGRPDGPLGERAC